MIYCSGCNKKIYFWQKVSDGRTTWHYACWKSWEEGYNIATKFAYDMNRRLNLPDAGDIYRLTNQYNTIEIATNIGEELKKKLGYTKCYDTAVRFWKCGSRLTV